MEINSVDRISSLPEFVLHDILSILPKEEAARTSLLSKQWKRIWESFPISNFNQHTFTKIPMLIINPSPECTRRVDSFLNFVKRSLIRSTHCDRRGNKFSLTVTIADPKMASKVNECLELALNSGAIDVSVDLFPYILVTRGAYRRFPETTIVPNPLIKYSSVQELYLSGISLSEESIHEIVHNCPNIRSIALRCLKGLRKLVIKRLDRLEQISISSTELMSVDINAPKLRSFEFWSYGEDGSKFTVIDMTSCRGLKSLRLESLTITDESFHSLISKFPLLEDLSIQSVKMLQRVKISAQRLKSLEFDCCNKIEAFEIDAPVLFSFTYRSEILPRLILNSTPSDMEINHILKDIPVDTSHFVNLRKFLATSTAVEDLTVTVNNIRELTFDREELGRFVIPPLCQLQHLKLEIDSQRQSEDEATLIKGLFWSCYPKRLSVSWEPGTIPLKSFQKVFCGTFISNNKEKKKKKKKKKKTMKGKRLSCCGSSNVKCWRHYLKSATFEESIGGRKICLDWDDSIS